ncbi:hypothetical protein [Conexibacter woesei]|uniref:Peptidase U32 n=1 Tax=Conexibacter woesei (strain DSM 14684 / CCUG 47730 / CIP 108061 / JCM 11494 / NBRC 100937 / ID131577) TaxID=469383 RepID=D3F3K5_CONWI|nr:hypothetical protein [Conexibacter woesei]ADB52370.1 hypothetical protein Cwoe_3953 [Conexibacter woesei DSM 14684]
MSVAPILARLGLVPETVPPSAGRFPDGAHFRIEIPSIEGPAVLDAALSAAREYGVVVNRVSQGSGAMLLRDAELRAMAAAGREAGMEVCLFVGPRAGYDVGAHARSPEGAGEYGQLRGSRQLASGVADVLRAVEAGIRSFLVGDEGLLSVLVEMQALGELPAGCVWKLSVTRAPSNPISLRLLERLGATTVNVPSDVGLAQLAEMRAAVELPLDLYVEAPDSLGGVVRGHESAALIRAGAPLYAKFGLRNAPPLYPAGGHVEELACAMAREKVRRAAVAMEWLARDGRELVQSAPGAAGLALPEPPESAEQPESEAPRAPQRARR